MRTALATMAAISMLGIPASANAPKAQYRCADGTRLVAAFNNAASGPGSVVLLFSTSGRRITLPQGVSADGGRYAAGKIQFWIKGRQATFTRAGRATTCKTDR